MSFDTLIRHGSVVFPETGVQAADIAIHDGRIAAILAPGAEAAARETIDASGRHVFPGLIDAHIHFGFAEPVTEYSTETPVAEAPKAPRTIVSVPGAAVGRRKQAIARVRLVPGTGTITSTSARARPLIAPTRR